MLTSSVSSKLAGNNIQKRNCLPIILCVSNDDGQGIDFHSCRNVLSIAREIHIDLKDGEKK